MYRSEVLEEYPHSGVDNTYSNTLAFIDRYNSITNRITC